MTIEFYKKVGFTPPWIGYYASIGGTLVGAAAYKGKPVNGKVEIAYGTFPQFQQQGIGTAICRKLVQISLETDPSVIITARTLPENNYSAKILRKNNFALLGPVWDDEDGEVWEWVYRQGDSK
jgi:RimJ/RimL family protein N-acetyltransferase